MNNLAIHMSNLGESGLLFQSDGPLCVDTQGHYWALEELCRDLEGVNSLVLGMHSLLVCLRLDANHDVVGQRVQQLWSEITPLPPKTTVHDIPVHYIGEDIKELADKKGMTIQDVVRLHTETEYTVFALGSQPGFPYLGGLDERLFSPRRPEPRVRVEAGSVVIGGGQTGVISRTSPSGWHIIGRTEVEFFDLNNEQPALLSPGDKVRFVSIGAWA